MKDTTLQECDIFVANMKRETPVLCERGIEGRKCEGGRFAPDINKVLKEVDPKSSKRTFEIHLKPYKNKLIILLG